MTLKVRIGVGVASPLDTQQLGAVVDGIGAAGLDSLWLSEILTGPLLDPLVGLAWASAHHPTVKLGTTMLLPGQHPLRVAKQLATLDALSDGRLLITFVPGIGRPPEREAIGGNPAQRGAAIDELLPVLRRLWAGETVTYDGVAASLRAVTLSPRPTQDPLEVWLGGMAPAALDRCGRLGDGWLPSLCTPDAAFEGKQLIDDAAARAGRQISPEHFGVSIGYAYQPLPEHAREAIGRRSRGVDPDLVVPIGLTALRRLLEAFVEVGFSKFVVRPIEPPADWDRELTALAGAVGDLQT